MIWGDYAIGQRIDIIAVQINPWDYARKSPSPAPPGAKLFASRVNPSKCESLHRPLRVRSRAAGKTSGLRRSHCMEGWALSGAGSCPPHPDTNLLPRLMSQRMPDPLNFPAITAQMSEAAAFGIRSASRERPEMRALSGRLNCLVVHRVADTMQVGSRTVESSFFAQRIKQADFRDPTGDFPPIAASPSGQELDGS